MDSRETTLGMWQMDVFNNLKIASVYKNGFKHFFIHLERLFR